jgi:hypothetical protein
MPLLSASNLLALQRAAGNAAVVARWDLPHSMPARQHADTPGRITVQRSPGRYDDDGLDVEASTPSGSAAWFFPPEQLKPDLHELLSGDASQIDAIETAIAGVLSDEDGPVHETWVYLESPPVADLLRRDLASWTGSRTLPQFAAWIARRAAARRATALLYDLEQHLEADGEIRPGVLNWSRELAALRASPPIEPTTVIEASKLDRYDLALTILEGEAAGFEDDPSAELHTEALATAIWDRYAAPAEAPAALADQELVRTNSEAFLETWLPQIVAARFVPDDFDIGSFAPESSGGAEEERNALLDTYLSESAQPAMQLYLLDRWVGDPERSDPEGFLNTEDLDALREDLLEHLADDFLRWAAGDESYRVSLWDEVAKATAYDALVTLVTAGRASEALNAGLEERFLSTDTAGLTEDEWAIANDPAGYAERTTAAATGVHTLLGRLTPGVDLETSLIGWFDEAAGLLPGTDEAEAALVGSLIAVFHALVNVGELVVREKEAARERLRDELDLSFDAIADIIRDEAEFADEFLAEQWIPMLKTVALERVTANKAELESALADWPRHREEAGAKFRICAHFLGDMIDKLESGEYETVELEGQALTAEHLEQLRVAREFCLGEAESLDDPEKAEETRDQMEEAVAGFATVEENILSGEYEPIDYSKAVYDEARQRLGIEWYSDFTTMRVALQRWEVVPENAFLAYAIARWQWEEKVRELDEQFALFVGLGLLTVASLVVPGAAGAVLAGIDLAVGLSVGVEAVDDAYDVLALARLDTDGSIRGITVEQAEEALTTAWIGLGLSIIIAAGLGALFGRLLIKGRGATAIPGELTRLNALIKVDAVAAEKLLAKVPDAYKAEELLELTGDSVLLGRMLDKTENVKDLEFALMFGEAAEIARMLDLAGDAKQLARVFDHATDAAGAFRLLEAVDDPAQLAKLLDRYTADRLLVFLDAGASPAAVLRLDAVLDLLPASVRAGLDDAALARLADARVIGHLEAVADLQGVGRAAGLEDWVSFHGVKGMDELVTSTNELREVQRLVDQYPDAVIRMGGEQHAPIRPGTHDERMPAFDLTIEHGGAVDRSVEVSTVQDPVAQVPQFTTAVRHAADKVAERAGAGMDIPGALDAAIYHRLDVRERSLGRGKARMIDADGNVRIVTRDKLGVIRHEQDAGNLYDDFTEHLSDIANTERLDRVTLIDDTTGAVHVFERQDGTWVRTE